MVAIATKHSGYMKAFNFWNVEELAEEGGAWFILRSSACPSADTRRLIRASLIATPPWFISEALAQLIQWCASCQPNDLTSLDVNPPPCGGQQCIHALALLLLMVFMSLQMNRKVKKSTHTLLSFSVLSGCYCFGGGMFSHLTANTIATKARWTKEFPLILLCDRKTSSSWMWNLKVK